jgi:rhodanese-related sulfurtransferase
MINISPSEFSNWIAEHRTFKLVDVREAWEHKAYNIGGQLIPMMDLMSRKKDLPKDIPLVIYCEHGIRSVIAAQRLEFHGYENLYNLSGGMRSWRQFLAGEA